MIRRKDAGGETLGTRVLIGTNTTGRLARGLYVLHEADDGTLAQGACCEMDDPSFVVAHPRLPLAYVVNELPRAPGMLTVVATADPPRVLHAEASGGHLPCHLALLDDARWLGIAHYGSGDVAFIRLGADGLPDGRRQLLRHEGRSQHPRRQTAPHAHCVVAQPGSHVVLVTDLGTDRIERYTLGDDDVWSPLDAVMLPPGTGVRHVAFIDDRHAVASLELTPGMLVANVQTWPWTLSPVLGLATGSAASEIAVHPGGHTVYVGVRGEDTIASIDVRDPLRPRLAALTAAGGSHPRHFALAPDSRGLLVALRDSDCVVGFGVGTDGALSAPVQRLSVPAPVCVCWLREA